MTLATARAVLIQDAMKTSNDVLLGHLLKAQRGERREQREVSTAVGSALGKRAQQAMEEAAKRRKEVQEQDRLAANAEEERKCLTAEAQKAAAEARLACLRQVVENRRDAARRRAEAARAKGVARWLQTEYPTSLARSMIGWYRGLSHVQRERYTREVKEMLRSGFFSRLPANIPDLWAIDDSLTFQWAQLAPPWGRSLAVGPVRSAVSGGDGRA